MARERGYFEYPYDLTPGKSENGGWSGLLFREGARGVAAHGTFYPDSDAQTDDSDEEGSGGSLEGLIKVAVGIAIGVVTNIVVVQAAPRVTRWWNEEALPGIRAKFGRESAANVTEVVASADELVATDSATHSRFPEDVEAVLEEWKQPMGSDQAHRRLLAILLAAAFIAEQMRALGGARLEGAGGDLAALEKALGKLTGQLVTDGVNRMLEANTSLLDEASSAQLLEVFGGGTVVDGVYVPIRNTRVREALYLADGEY